jgi:hypothetical protein
LRPGLLVLVALVAAGCGVPAVTGMAGPADPLPVPTHTDPTSATPEGGAPISRARAPCPDGGPTTVAVVRHAERADDDPRDPHLSAAGHARAEALAEALAA